MGSKEYNRALSEKRADAVIAYMKQKYGVAEGTKVWESFRQREDPEAVLTVHDGTSFPYAGKPAKGTMPMNTKV